MSAELLERRPEVRAAELALLSAGYQHDAVWRSFLPSLSLIGSVGYVGSQQDEALHAYAETALTALAEVETALALPAEAADDAVRTSFNRYLQDMDPFLPVLESHQRARDGSSAHIAAHFARLENRIALDLALGGDLDTSVDATAVDSTVATTVETTPPPTARPSADAEGAPAP